MSQNIADSIYIYNDTGTKEIDYFGFKLHVPDYIHFVAMDQDGSVFGYEIEPKYNSLEWTHELIEDVRLNFLAELINPKILPQDSLVTY